MNNKESIDAIAHKVSVINEFIENWKKSGCVLAIERKVVKDNVSAIYELLHQIKPDAQNVNTEPTQKEPAIVAKPEPKPEPAPAKEKIVFELQEEKKAEPETPKIASVATQQPTTVLGETLQKNKRALYEDFGEKDDLVLTPISDLSKGIGLNDKFLFAKELFGGNAQRFDSTVNTINSLTSCDEAMKYIHSNFEWNEDSSIVKHFISLVKRRFM